MYGLWAKGIFNLTGSWQGVQFVQLGIFVALGMWIILELASISSRGTIAAAIFAATLATLNRFGLISLAGSIISEGLFYPMILLVIALSLRWLRVRRPFILFVVAFFLFAMGQLRTAAILVFLVPLMIAIYALVMQFRTKQLDRSALAAICGLAIGAVILPPLTGKDFLQFGTVRDGSGFAIFPRISLLPVPQNIVEQSPDWVIMAESWRRAAAHLNSVALTQFDAQLQETIRFELGPRLLLPAVLNQSPDEVDRGWADGTYYADARRIAIQWILLEWPKYLQISGYHLWGMLTMANFMDSADRIEVWNALHDVSPTTWRFAPMRTDYPLNQIDHRLKWHTELIYRLIRYASIIIVTFGGIAAVFAVRQTLQGREVCSGGLAVSLAVAWCLLHSVPAALLVYPEYRYTYANLLVLISGAAAWLAFTGGVEITRNAN